MLNHLSFNFILFKLLLLFKYLFSIYISKICVFAFKICQKGIRLDVTVKRWKIVSTPLAYFKSLYILKLLKFTNCYPPNTGDTLL